MSSRSPNLYDTSGLIKASRHQHATSDDVGLFSLISKLTPNIFKKALSLKPSSCALLIGVLSAALAFPLLNFLNPFVAAPYSTMCFVCLQSILAYIFAVAFGLDKWWRLILFAFPIAAWLLHGLNLPPWLYLIGFIFSLSLFWNTFRTQVPFYPSRLKVWQQLTQLVPENRPIKMIDIGSGLGDLSMYMAKHRPNSHFNGIEIAPLPWLVSVLRAWFKKSSAEFMLGDYNKLNFADYDIVFAYLSPAAMTNLWKKASAEMHKGSLLISYEFEIIDVPPTSVLQPYGHTSPIYIWSF